MTGYLWGGVIVAIIGLIMLLTGVICHLKLNSNYRTWDLDLAMVGNIILFIGNIVWCSALLGMWWVSL